MWKMRKILLVLGTYALMVVCGVAAYVMALMFLMELGTKLHGNYEYYGSFSVVVLIYVAGAMGFLAPGFIVWHLCNRHNRELSWQFSLRTLLIAMTLVAVTFGIIAVSVAIIDAT